MVGKNHEATTHDRTAASRARDTSVLDLAHLGKYTAGDDTLMYELLALFSAQLSSQVVVLGEPCGKDDWLVATHTLKGAAGAVGAWQIARTAEALEQLDPLSDADQCSELVELLAKQAAECLDVIRNLPQAA